ncbi:MAG: hypothetical protein ACRD0N_13430 [Acidimicrobiales bacterium]
MAAPDRIEGEAVRRVAAQGRLDEQFLRTLAAIYMPEAADLTKQLAPDQSFSVDNPIGADVAIAARSRYIVDWGDGTTTATSSQVGPVARRRRHPHLHPHGAGRHHHRHAPVGATWRSGSARGDLRDLRTAATLTLPVRQLQAVRNV